MDLSDFYRAYSCGLAMSGKRSINRLSGPNGRADIRLGKGGYEFDPDLAMYEKDEENAVIFFEIGEGLSASIGLHGGKRFYSDERIADSLEEFLEKSSILTTGSRKMRTNSTKQACRTGFLICS